MTSSGTEYLEIQSEKKRVSRSWAARDPNTALLAAAAEQPPNYSRSRSQKSA